MEDVQLSNSFWEGTRREKTRLKKDLLSQLVSQNRIHTFEHGCIVHAFNNFSEAQIMYIISKRGVSQHRDKNKVHQ